MKLSKTYLYMNEFGRWGNKTNNMKVIKYFIMKYQMSSSTEHKNMLGFTYILLNQCLTGCFLVTLLYRHPVENLILVQFSNFVTLLLTNLTLDEYST